MHKKLSTVLLTLLASGGMFLSACSEKDTPENPGGGGGSEPGEEVSVPLKINTANVNDINISLNKNGEYKIMTNGRDPWFTTQPLESVRPEQAQVLTFDYKASKDVQGVTVYFGDPIDESRKKIYADIPASPGSWQTHSIVLTSAMKEFNWGSEGNYLRVDLGSKKDVMLMVRDLRLRGITPEEKAALDGEAQHWLDIDLLEERLPGYFNSSFKSEVTQVAVGSDKVTITGINNEPGTVHLAEVTPYEDLLLLKEFRKVKLNIPAGPFTVTIDRVTEYDGYPYDRLLSKFCLVSDDNAIASFARFVDGDAIDQSNASPLPDYSGDITKGGEYIGDRLNDLDLLGLKAVMVHCNPSVVMWPSAADANAVGDQVIVHRYLGKDYYFSKGYFESQDKIIMELQNRGIAVFGVFLVRPETPILPNADHNYSHELGMLFQHPDYADAGGTMGHFCMVNLTEAKAVNYWAACVDFIAKRYSDGSHGRIHRYVFHNEIDDPANWNNCGWKPFHVYTDMYAKSIRLGYNIIKQYNPHVWVMAPLTQAWTKENLTATRNEFASKKIMDELVLHSEKEGDFRWGVGYHAYPENFSPTTWLDASATYSMNTKLLTLKNLEVLDKWLKMAGNRYKGSEIRCCWLTEQGASTPRYTVDELNNQAACAAYALNKVRRLSAIETLIWHAIADNDVEGTLNLGLHYGKFDTKHGSYAPKPSWYVYQAFGTPNESAVLDPYKRLIGIDDWDDIIHPVND